MSNNIPITVGILTYNREEHLRRALESVKDFDDIIIADGGSRDGTLDIAREYGCRIIQQQAVAQAGGKEFHPITDFAAERNQFLEHAKHDWFFWLDSDEYISQELHDELVAVAQTQPPKHHAYNIRIVRQNPDATITYRDWARNEQIRFFNLQTGGRFMNKIHEKFKFDRTQFSVGSLQGAWYVPTGKPSFAVYKKTVDHRLRIMVEENPPTSLIQLLRKGLFKPMVQLVKTVSRALIMRLYNPWRELIPLSLELHRIYSFWVITKENWKAYGRKK